MSRLQGGGLVDRTAPINFSFNGREMTGFKGDTLASALLANDVKLMARSFKYHRPRGVLSAGSEEPNALVQIGTGNQSTPNIRATTQEIYSGLTSHSQNCFPSLNWDFLAFNDWLSPFIGAGFYYKTFMWPAAFWEKIYEPIIRRAAGLGRLSGHADTDLHDRAFAHCDLLVIGAGPAGLMAALCAAKAGATVILADEDFVVGGRLNSETITVANKPGCDWASQTYATLVALPNVKVMTRTTVTGVYDGGTYGALQRVGEHLAKHPSGLPLTTFWRIAAKRCILAGGAIERSIAFANNDRPGIMMAGALRSYVNRYAVAPGQRVALFCNNNDAHKTAFDLRAKGIDVVAVIDTRADATIDGDFNFLAGGTVITTHGRTALKSITLLHNGTKQKLDVDCLAVSGGWNPSVHLSAHLGARPVWREDIAAFVPAPDAVPHMQFTGACAGDMSTRAALKGGVQTAKIALGDIGLTVPPIRTPQAEDNPVSITPFWHVASGRSRAWIDLQNDVTVKDIKQAHQENFRSVEHMKRYTTLGMATDQGKTSNMGALAIMAELTDQTIPQVGTTTFRPPYTPVPIAALGARSTGKDFAPERFIPTDRWSREQNAPMMEAGLWYRPSWFIKPGDTNWRQSCDREVTMVRQSVGICDVTTLGKIDVQGPDAATFLDRLYINMMSSLKIGRIRYGLMLREDGFVMDDGTVARISPHHFVLTTTTAGAAQVMTHMEFCAQCLWPELDVQFISVTEQWTQLAIAGPQSRAVLQELIKQDISTEALPYMAYIPVEFGEINGRLFRISFSGELAFELAIPARYGDCVMRTLYNATLAYDGGAYGMEALNVMRIEKGFITHAEIDGRVTADDIGFAAMISQKKDCIGKVASQRPGLHGAARQHLVCLRPVGAIKRILAGAHVISEGQEPNALNDQGYVTSACYSPTLQSVLALAFIKNGHARMGEHVRAVNPLHQTETICVISPTVSYDVKGERLRG